MARTPKYKAAETEMISRITNGTWEIGKRLPNEFELADEFGVSQGTMRRALMSLESMGLLNRKPGRGTLVAANAPSKPMAVVHGITPKPCLVGPDGQPLEFKPFRSRADTRGATTAEADLFGTSRLARLQRTFNLGSLRAAAEEILVPENMIPALEEDGPVDLGDLLLDYGLTTARVTADATAEMTDMSMSVSLSVDRHTALLVVRQTAFDSGDRAIGQQVLRIASPGARLTFV